MGWQFRELDAARSNGLFPYLRVRTHRQGALRFRHNSLRDYDDGHLSGHEADLDISY